MLPKICFFHKKKKSKVNSYSQSENDDNELSNIRNTTNKLPFEEKPITAEFFINFSIGIPICNAFFDLENFKKKKF